MRAEDIDALNARKKEEAKVDEQRERIEDPQYAATKAADAAKKEEKKEPAADEKKADTGASASAAPKVKLGN